MKIELIAIVDRSGSMSSMKLDMEGGFNQMIEDQKKIEGELNVTLVTFDDRIETIYEGKPLADVPPLVIVPRGSTALLDAIGRTLLAQNARIAGNFDKVIVAIVTDGAENSSREYDLAKIKGLVKQAEEKGWEFIFLGANMDAFSMSEQMGFSQNSMRNTQGYDSHDSKSVRGMTEHLSATVGNLRSGK